MWYPQLLYTQAGFILSKSFVSSERVSSPPTSTDILGSKDCFQSTESWKQKTPCHSSVGRLNSPKTPFSTLSQVYQIMVFLLGAIKLTVSTSCFPIAHSSHYFTCGDLNYFWNYSLVPPPFKYLQAYLWLKVVVAHCMPKPLAREQSVWFLYFKFVCA